MSRRHGLVLGKFLPPHVGHLALCEAASRMCDELTIVVGSLAGEPIAGTQRVAWMEALMPSARVVHLTAELPQQPSDHPRFWELWRRSLLDVLPSPPDRVFTSDAYGARLASELGATWIPIDPGRTSRAISATQIRTDPMGHFAALPRIVRPAFARRISVFGPESTGKTTLARALADELSTVYVPEFARGYLEARAGRLVRDDLAIIAEGQRALEDALAFDAHRVLVCDTDPLATVVWSEALHGEASDALRAAGAAGRYELTLLCDVDLPWQPDPVRYLPDDRAAFFARCETALREAGRAVVTVRGAGTARLDRARAAVAELIERTEGPR